MTARRMTWGLLGLAVFLVVLVVLSSLPKTYKVRFQLDTANGLRKGSPVKVGGVAVGTIKSFKLGPGDYPVAEANLDPDKAHVGQGATARIVTTNLLGSKVLELDPGRGALPSGTVIPRSRISTPVDIDQVLNVLEPDTRARLRVLINEAGVAVTGRKMDFNQALALLPQDLEAGTRLLNQVVSDNHNLRQAVAASSGFVSRIAEQRRQLSQLVDSAGQTMQAVAAKHQALGETLTRAPATLQSLRHFLGDLRSTAQPLGPASRAISATAPGLTATLAQLGPFQRAADPALRQALAAAPSLTQLGVEATPVIQRANPTLGSLATFAHAVRPVSKTLDISIDNVMGLLEGWARAIQDRDGVSHMFHGKATIGADFFRALVNASLPAQRTARHTAKRTQPQPALPQRSAPTLPQSVPKLLDGTVRQLLNGPVSKLLDGPVNKVLNDVGGVLPKLTGNAPPPPASAAPQPRSGDMHKLLDYLLGR